MSMWNRRQAFALLQSLEIEVAKEGYHVALAGSVCVKGESDKDLDIIVYPHDTSKLPGLVAGAIERAGLIYKRPKNDRYAEDGKEIRVYETAGGKRVDIFFLQ